DVFAHCSKVLDRRVILDAFLAGESKIAEESLAEVHGLARLQLLRFSDDASRNEIHALERGDECTRWPYEILASLEDIGRRMLRVLLRFGSLGPRLDDASRLQRSDDRSRRRSPPVRSESLDVVLLTIRDDHRIETAARLPLDVERDALKQAVGQRLWRSVASEIDQHVAISARIVPREQQAIAEPHLVNADRQLRRT